jgi:hypothetical protein
MVTSWKSDRESIDAATTTIFLLSVDDMLTEGDAQTDAPPTGVHHPKIELVSC